MEQSGNPQIKQNPRYTINPMWTMPHYQTRNLACMALCSHAPLGQTICTQPAVHESLLWALFPRAHASHLCCQWDPSCVQGSLSRPQFILRLLASREDVANLSAKVHKGNLYGKQILQSAEKTIEQHQASATRHIVTYTGSGLRRIVPLLRAPCRKDGARGTT